MLTYEFKNYRQIQEQASVVIEETSSGVFKLTKNCFGSRHVPVTSKHVMESLRGMEGVAFIDINRNIHTNFIPVLRTCSTVIAKSNTDVRSELSELLRESKRNRMMRPTHVVLFGDEEDEQMDNVFIYQDQIGQTFDFLKDKVKVVLFTKVNEVYVQNR